MIHSSCFSPMETGGPGRLSAIRIEPESCGWGRFTLQRVGNAGSCMSATFIAHPMPWPSLHNLRPIGKLKSRFDLEC